LFYKAINFYKTIDLYKALNIYKILLFLNSRSRIYGVSETREDKASRTVLDVEEVITLLSISAKA